MGQEVLDNKNHVDQTVQAFTLTAQQAAADVNNAGQTQTERVQSTGNSAVESVKTAQGTATQAVETAKTEAVKAVQTEGTTQTGNVSAEGEKQVQAVQAAAQEIVADREQIAQNKAGIEGLKQGKADAIVETASGEIIQTEDSSSSGFEGLRIFGKSTQDGIPTPESPVPIVSVGETGKININVSGKNVLPYKTMKIGTEYGLTLGYLEDEQCFLLNGTSTMPSRAYFLTNINIQSDVGSYYTISSFHLGGSVEIPEGSSNYSVFYLGSGDSVNDRVNWLEVNLNNNNNNASALLNQTHINSMWLYITKGNTYNNYKFRVQLEKGSVTTSYEPYHTPQTLALSTPNGLPGIKVDKDGNYTDSNGQQWVCDEIDLKNSEFVQRINKIDLKKLSIIATNRISSVGGTFFYSTQLPAPLNDVSVRGTMSNIGMCGNAYSEKGDFVWAFTNPANNMSEIRFGFLDDTIDTVEKAMNKLSGLKEAYAMYILKTPIKRVLTLAEIEAYKKLHTNYPITIISNDESAHMEVSYVADTKNYIDKKFKELNQAIVNTQIALL